MTTEATPDTFPCHFCGAPIKSILSSTTCRTCAKVWNIAYNEGRKFEREYGKPPTDGEQSIGPKPTSGQS